jgi:hypothetical protein
MTAKLIVLKDGKPFFEYSFPINGADDLAKGAHEGLLAFRKQHPNVSLVDASISLKFE